MILQSLLFPDSMICDRENMYYNYEGSVVISLEKRYCSLDKQSKLLTNTYFNALSIGKWKKYTIIDNISLKLYLKGAFLIRIFHIERLANTNVNTLICEKEFNCPQKEEIIIPIESDKNTGLYSFELLALENKSEYWGGEYIADVSENDLADVKIAIGICTFRREKYLYKNLEILFNEFINNPKSILYKKIEIFVSDNGKTIKDTFNSQFIHIISNRNLGGAGGFTRALIEILKAKDESKITHVLLMDDDVRINPSSFYKTYCILRTLKEEYKNAFIGGHMLRTDSPNIQSEAADHWDVVSHHPVKYNYDLEDLKYVLKNEIEDSVNYLSWWYCCMPINIVNENNLPLPIFIKRDDIEYGLRNGEKFITMNGICVWHEPFDFKTSSHLEYYYFRNLCIMNSKHRLSFSDKSLIKELWKRVRSSLLRYRYKEAELALLGVNDFLKGIDWLKKQDGELLNKEIMQLGYKKEPVENLNYVFSHGSYESNLNYTENAKKKVARLLTLNGWLLRKKKNVIVPSYQPSIALFYRVNHALNYEEISNSGFITKKDYHALFAVLGMYFKVKKQIKRNFARVSQEYRDRYNELTNLDFWNQYLFYEGADPEIKSQINWQRKPSNNKYEYKKVILSFARRMFQHIIFWVPVKRNRVMIYAHERKGFACNPKYIVLKLLELYGNKLELIWVTSHPDTCKEIENLGVTVVEVNSKEQIKKYIRSRFFITNDSFPAWAVHRWNQKWMNTWHGAMNYKHIGYDYLAPRSRLSMRLFKLYNRQPDFFLSGSGFFLEDTSRSYNLDKKVFIKSGLPRNDLLFTENEKLRETIKEKLHIKPENKIILFAPTFRRGMKSDTYGLDFEKLRISLEKKFGYKWVILFRNHNFVYSKQNVDGSVMDVSNYDDMQELLFISDILISDYSSCMYDFSITGRPCFVYAPDLDYYLNNDRSFAYPIKKWPFAISKTNEELEKNIAAFRSDEYREKIKEHFRDTESYDDGCASQRIAEIVGKYCL